MKRRLIVAIATLAVAGCGLGAGDSVSGGSSVVVTQNFGAKVVAEREESKIPKGETVMRMLQRNFDVDTRYGGGYVQSIDGLAGSTKGTNRIDWFYFVNGELADTGAGERKVGRGDRVWWDRRDWSATADVNAVVGSYPEPFRSGKGGKRPPLRVDCAKDSSASCDTVSAQLTSIGAKPALSAMRSAGGTTVARIKVGHWDDVRADFAARRLEVGPQTSGVFARPSRSGKTIDLLDAKGKVARTLGPGSGLIAATKYPEEGPTWIVTGTDDAGLKAAVANLREDSLANRFAVAIENGKPISLPVPAS